VVLPTTLLVSLVTQQGADRGTRMQLLNHNLNLQHRSLWSAGMLLVGAWLPALE